MEFLNKNFRYLGQLARNEIDHGDVYLFQIARLMK